MVEGVARFIGDPSQYSVQIVQDFNGRNSKQAISLVIQVFVAALISNGCVATVVGFTVNLNDKARLRNVKIHYVRAERVLLPHTKSEFL